MTHRDHEDHEQEKELTAEERRARFERECAKLDPEEEQAMAEGMGGELEKWVEY